MKTPELLKVLQNPENQYRGKPFWAWNGELSITELKRQIDIMKQMGFGGFFMHSRTGLKTEYLGKHWFDCIRECAKYAYSVGLEAWLYDEDRWPSGSAGGLVTRKESNRLRFISLYSDDTDMPVLARFAYKNNKDFFPVKNKSEVPGGYTYQVYAEELMENNSFYNGYTYLDTMNPAAVKDFFNSTLELYKKECGELFGKEIKGIFTDEPHRGAVFAGFGISNINRKKMCPYTGSMFGRYKADWNEDLADKLPLVFFGDYPNQTGYRYMETAQRLFLDAFSKPYQKWCKDNNLLLTGHYLHEDNLAAQGVMCGSLMRTYEYMDYPGIDNLSLNNQCYWAVKQCVSVAKQLNKPFVLSELYGGSGWGASLSDFKYTGDWQAFYGITLRCPHLSWYTMKGEAKRDYPMSILHQAAIDKDWHFLEDYYARLSYIYTNSKEICGVLVINPIEKAWETLNADWVNGLSANDDNLTAIEKQYVDEFNALRKNQIAFDYADEGILSEHGRITVENGTTYIEIGAEKYPVLYDNGNYVRQSTKDLISEFKEKGGIVVADIDKLPKTACSHEDIAVTLRDGGNDKYLIAMNFSRDKDYKGVQIIQNIKAAYEYDVHNNKIIGKHDGAITADFCKGQERVYILTDESVDVSAPVIAEKAVTLDGEYDYALSEYNTLPLKNAAVTLNGKAIFTGDALDADKQVRLELGLEVKHGEMLQPWFKEKFDNNYARERGRIKLEYGFEIADYEGELYFAYEGDYAVTVNGKKPQPTSKFWKDICFKVVKIDGLFKHNTVVLEKDFAESDDIEYGFILGGFGVDGDDSLTVLPEKLSPSDFERQGLPYYAGEVIFNTGIVGKAKIHYSPAKRVIASKVIADGADINLSFYPHTAAIDAKTTLKLSLVLSAEKLFRDR